MFRGVHAGLADFAPRHIAPRHGRILTLDGGGSKGFYTLGVLHELEAMLGSRLHERFDLIYGTSTGSISRPASIW